MTHKWIDEGKLRWCWLQHGGAALMLQEIAKEGPHSQVPGRKVGPGRIDLLHLRGCPGYLQRGDLTRDSSLETLRRERVTSMSDPDGYVIEFESYTDVPEDTEFSEHKDAEPPGRPE
jgi:lactoylglutathione lyase